MRTRLHRFRSATIGIVLAVLAGLAFAAPAHAADATFEERFPRAAIAQTVADTLSLAVTDPVSDAQLAGITTFSLRGGQIASLTELAPLTGLLSLSVPDNDLTDLAGLAAFPQLTQLSAHINQISDVSALEGATTLRELTLGSNPLRAGFGAFASLTSLRQLNLASAGITDALLAEVVKATGMVSLNLSSSGAQSPRTNTLTSFTPITELQQLESLVLSGNSGLDSLAGIGGMPRLNTLNVSGTAVTDFHELNNWDRGIFAGQMFSQRTVIFSQTDDTVTYTHPYVGMTEPTRPSRAPVAQGDVPLGGVVDWTPATGTLTITWKTADLAAHRDPVLKTPVQIEYDHGLFTVIGTRYVDGRHLVRFLEEFTIPFDLAGGTGAFPDQIVIEGSPVSEPAIDPVREGYTFAGWTDAAGAPFDFAAPTTAPVTVFAAWTAVVPPVETVTVSFDLRGGTGDFPRLTLDSGTAPTAPSATPTRDQHRFAGWVNAAGAPFDFAAPVTADTTVFAAWTAVDGGVTTAPPGKTPGLSATGSPAGGTPAALLLGGALLAAGALLIRRRARVAR